MKKILFYSFLILLFSTGCRQIFAKRIKGNGNISSETRSVGSFHSIDVSGAITVMVAQGPEAEIKVEGDQNLLEYVEVYESGGVLKIHQRKGVNLKPSRSLKIHVTNPEFKSLQASGACDIIGKNLIRSDERLMIDLSGACDINMEVDAPSVFADASGAGKIVLAGKTRDLEIDGSGSTDLKCLNLMAENVKIDISGAGDAEVFASVKLDVEVSGAGNVKYKGNASVNQDISGAGSVKKIN